MKRDNEKSRLPDVIETEFHPVANKYGWKLMSKKLTYVRINATGVYVCFDVQPLTPRA